MSETQWISDGGRLGLKEDALRQYVDERRGAEEKRLDAEREREERREVREHEKLKLELEFKTKEEERKMRELQLASEGGGRAMGPNTQLKLNPYKSGDDVGIYLKTFERIKLANNWNENTAVTALMNGVIGSKISAYLDTLPPNMTLESIVKSILQNFGTNVYEHQNRFRFAKQGEEPFGHFVFSIQENLIKMCKLAEVPEDFQSFQDFAVKEQVLRSADKLLAEFLKERNIFKLDLAKIIELGENFQAVHGRPKKSQSSTAAQRLCYTCGSSEHLSRSCGSKLDKEGKAIDGGGQRWKDSVGQEKPADERRGIGKDEKSQRRCHICDEVGHIARFCPKKKSKASDLISFSLDNQSNLPVVIGKCNGKKIRVLRDTGCTCVLVKTGLVKPTYFTGETAKIKLADNRVIEARKAKVNIKCDYFEGHTTAVCLDDLPYDVLVGNVTGARCACKPTGTGDWLDLAEVDDSVENGFHVTTRNAKRIMDEPEPEYTIGRGRVKWDMVKMNTKEFIDIQQKDETLSSCFKKLNRVQNKYPRFMLKSGVLVRVANSGKHIKDMLTQVVLPVKLRHKVMELAHDTVMAGHLGITKTQKRIMNHFYWPGAYQDIRNFCLSCSLCQRSAIMKPAKAPLVNLPIITEPFSRVAMDIIGPLPKSNKGNRFVLVTIDLATKYPDAIPLKRIAEGLLDIFARVGLPKEILHDQGSNFMSCIMKRFNELLQIKRINTSPYHPECNGTCEGFNKTFKLMIKKICNDEPSYWDKFLQPLLFAYREVPQTSTGFSPFELLFGHTVRGPLFLLKEGLIDENCDPEAVPVTEHVLKMREQIKNFMSISNSNESDSKMKQKTYYDKNCRKRIFKPGDKVLLLLPTSSNKLLAEWRGPFEIVRKLNSVDYMIRIGDKERVFHVNMLKKFHERTSVSMVEECATVENDIDELDENVERLINRHADVFSTKPGVVKNLVYDIKIDPNTKPISSRPYRTPFHLKDKVKDEIVSWEKLGIIRKSNSEYASPIVVVMNSNKSVRLTVDFRKLNPHINCDNYPMPLREVVMEKLHGSKYMTKLDLTKAYLQIPLSEESKQYTSFVCDHGQYEFNVVPYGIKFGSGLCNRIMKNVLEGCDSFVTNFVDDIMVHSNSLEEHLEHLDIVLSKLTDAGMTLNRSKCRFAQTEVNFLGVRVGNGCITPDPEKVRAIRDFPLPKDKKKLRSYLGFIGYYRTFIPNLAKHIRPLTDLLKKSEPDSVKWTDDLIAIFDESKELISEEVRLTIPKPGCEFVVETDASNLGIGAVLNQKIDGKIVPISFISRVLNPAEVNYSVIEKECLAIKWAIDHFRPYLYASHFCVRTDHAPLSWLNRCKNNNTRLMRWALSLQSYDFHIEYVKGSDNFIADMFSRA